MSFAPRQNWNVYNEAIRGRAASAVPAGPSPDELTVIQEAFSRYADYYNTLQHARRQLLNAAAIDRDQRLFRWQQKVAVRQKLLAVFQTMDAARHG